MDIIYTYIVVGKSNFMYHRAICIKAILFRSSIREFYVASIFNCQRCSPVMI